VTTIWIDAQLSPAIATWITNTFGVTAVALRDLGLRDAEDLEIFEAAKSQEVIFMTKDSDFVDLVERLEAPPPTAWACRLGIIPLPGRTAGPFLHL